MEDELPAYLPDRTRLADEFGCGRNLNRSKIKA